MEVWKNRLVAVEALEHKNEAFFDRSSLIFEFVGNYGRKNRRKADEKGPFFAEQSFTATSLIKSRGGLAQGAGSAGPEKAHGKEGLLGREGRDGAGRGVLPLDQ